MDHNAKFSNQHCLSLTRLVVILLIGVMFTCSDYNAPLDMKPPDVPTGFSAISISDDRVVLTWDEMDNTTHYFLSKNNTDFDSEVSVSSYTSTSLKAHTIYFFYLKACNSGGCSPRTNLIFTTTPSVPNLTVKHVTSYTVSLSWGKSDGATHYVTDTGSIQITNQGGGSTSSTIPDLEAATPYTLRVRACDGYRCSPEVSIDVTTAPAAPNNLAVGEVTSYTISLSWGISDGATHYVVDAGSIQITNQGGESTFSTIPDLEAGTLYPLKIRACNKYGCSSKVGVDITTIPVAPKNFTHGTVTSTTATLKWDTATGAGFYIVYWGGKVIVTNRSGEEGATEHTVTGLTSDTEEIFGLEACNNFGCSSRTTLTLTTAPDAPKGLAVGEVTSYTISLSWGRSLGATHYVIDTGAIQLTNQGGGNTSSTIPGLEGGTRYPLKVRACNDYGCSSEASVDVTTIPATPKNFTVRKITSAAVILEWDAVTGTREYIFYQEKTPIATNTALTHTVVNLRFSTSYSFSVRACDSQGCSDPALKEVITLEAPDSFSTTYSNMESTTPDSSRPVFVSSESCNILDYTFAGKARYSIDRNTIGSDEPVLPTIDPITGVVSNNGVATPGAYKVTVTVPENVDCNTNVLVYNAITPAGKSALKAAIGSGIGFHGNTGNFNYIITSQITDMSRLFGEKDDFNGDIAEWDTSKVEDMSSMFSGASKFNQPIGEWDTSKVEDMGYMFRAAWAFNHPLNNWDTSKVEDMSRMFDRAQSFNQPLSNWDTSKVKDMSHMFRDAHKFDQPLSNWDTSQVTDMGYMFHNATYFSQPIGGWETSNVTRMSSMFNHAYAFNQPLNNWNTSQVTNMHGMFWAARAFNQPLNNWDTSKVVNMSNMFYQANSFDQDLSGWVVTNVHDYIYMFHSSRMERKTNQHPKWP